MDDELEELKRRKLEELKRQMEFENDRGDAEEQMDAQRKAVLRTVLTPAARERLGRVKIARPDVAEGIEQQIIMLAQRGAIKGKVDDNTLKKLLGKMTNSRKDIKIERR